MGLSQSHNKASAGCMGGSDWYSDSKRSEAISAKWDDRADVWRRLSCGGSQQPEPRSGHSVERIGSYCYVFGGYNEGHCMSDLYRLDLRSYEWEAMHTDERRKPSAAPRFRPVDALPVLAMPAPALRGGATAPVRSGFPTPEGRASHASCALPTAGGEGLYYIHGGSGAEWGRSSKNDLWCFATAKGRWIQVKQKGTPPPPMYGHSMALHRDHSLILFGGTTGWDYFNDVYAFDVATRAWRTLKVRGSPPSMRYKHQCGIIQDGLYILGGGQFHAPDYPFDVHRLDLVTLQWEQIVAPNAPTGRLAHACTVARGHPSQFQYRREEGSPVQPRPANKTHAGHKRARPASGSGRCDQSVPPERMSESPSGKGAEAMEVDLRRAESSSSTTSHDSLDDVFQSVSELRLGDQATSGPPEDGESDFILVFGGKDNRDRKLNDMYSFDVHARVWRCMSGPRGPASPSGPSAPGAGRAGAPRPDRRLDARDFHCMEVVRNQIFIFGGCAGEERLNDVWRYTMQQSPPSLQMLCTRFIREQVELHDEWEALAGIPHGVRASVVNLTPESEGLDFTVPENVYAAAPLEPLEPLEELMGRREDAMRVEGPSEVGVWA